MADDLIDGVLGGEEEKSEAAVPPTAAGAEAFAAAIAAIASRQDPEVARRTAEFLSDQSRLLRTQAQHLEDEHSSRLIHLRLMVSAAKRKRYADFMRNGLYTCIALLVLCVLLAAARMTFEAMTDHSLVVEDFTVPSGLAARGITSQALAEDLASRVAAIRATGTRNSIAASGEVRADQAGILKVQIPETGISVDELERFLHRWLGHQTVVNGELREEAAGTMSLVLHIAGADPIVVSGTSTGLDRLMQTAAEKAFAFFDPPNEIIYLDATGRRAEAYDAAVAYVHSAGVAALPSVERAAAYGLVGREDPDRRRGLASVLIATDIDPREAGEWAVAFEISQDLGHDEAALAFARKELGTKRREQPISRRDAYPRLMAEAHADIDAAMGDFTAAWRAAGEALDALHGDSNAVLITRYWLRGYFAALLHDEAAARQGLAGTLAAGAADSTALGIRWDISSAAGDWAAALEVAKARVAEEEAQKAAALKSNPQRPEFADPEELVLATHYRPLLAYAEAMTGDTASATALISQTPTDCYLCVRTRAKVAAAAGDAATADRWFAEAVRQAPDLQMAYYEWGEALLARGDLLGAARELSLAHEKGPHFADALKAWGDVLVRQGQRSDALAKYDEALKYAPNWAALKQAREAAAAKSRA